ALPEVYEHPGNVSEFWARGNHGGPCYIEGPSGHVPSTRLASSAAATHVLPNLAARHARMAHPDGCAHRDRPVFDRYVPAGLPGHCSHAAGHAWRSGAHARALPHRTVAVADRLRTAG